MLTKLQSLTKGQFKNVLIGGLVSSATFATLWWVVTFILSRSGIWPRHNILFYLLVCASFVLGAMIMIAHPKESAIKEDTSTTAGTLFKIVVLTAAFCVTSRIWAIDSLVESAKARPYWYWIALIIGAVVCFFVCKKIYRDNDIWKFTDNQKRFNILFWTFAILCGVISAYMVWHPFDGATYSVYHREAYIYDYYARYEGLPYTELTSSVYGHFGMLALPFFKLTGGISNVKINILVSFYALAGSLLLAGTVKILTKNKWMAFFSMIFVGLCDAAWRSNTYWQGAPHRTFLIAIVLFVFALFYTGKLPKWAKVALQLIVPAFALLWVADFGPIVLITFAAYPVLAALTRERSWKSFFKGILQGALCAIISLSVALAALNVYNLATGGPLTITLLFYPLLGSFSSELTHILTYFLPTTCFHIFWFIMLFLSVLTFALKNLSSKTAPIAAMAILALGTYTYFISRPLIYYLFMYSLPVSVIFIAYLFERTKSKQIKSFIACALVLLLSYNMWFLGLDIYRNIDRQVTMPQETQMVSEVSDYIRENYDHEMYGFGSAVHEVYNELGWTDNDKVDYIHIFVAPNGYHKLKERIREHDEFLIITNYDYCYDEHPTDSSWWFVNERLEDTGEGESVDFSDIRSEYTMVDEKCFDHIFMQYWVKKGTEN